MQTWCCTPFLKCMAILILKTCYSYILRWCMPSRTWRFAGRPTSLSPFSVKATTEGVVLWPSAFSMTLEVCNKFWESVGKSNQHVKDMTRVRTFPSITATQELVVPKSIPMTSSALTFVDTLRAVGTRLTQRNFSFNASWFFT
jgi:hypothetical protein